MLKKYKHGQEKFIINARKGESGKRMVVIARGKQSEKKVGTTTKRRKHTKGDQNQARVGPQIHWLGKIVQQKSNQP